MYSGNEHYGLRLAPNPVADTLATARIRLRDALNALVVCEANGWTTDAAFCQREAKHYAHLITRFETRLISSRPTECADTRQAAPRPASSRHPRE